MKNFARITGSGREYQSGGRLPRAFGSEFLAQSASGKSKPNKEAVGKAPAIT
jgi:hypothetical protein